MNMPDEQASEAPEEPSFGGSVRMFQITEADLVELERLLPVMCDWLYPSLAKSQPGSNKLRMQLRKVKDIVSNVRWNYGPPLDVGIIKCGE
jgi:hypothetical protein